MFSALRVLILGAFVPLAFCQTPQVPPVTTGSVEGIVVNAAAREPLKKAWVGLGRTEGTGSHEIAITDSTGRFAFKGIAPGRYTLDVQRNGYVRQSYGQRGPDSPGTILTIGAGQTIRDIEIRLQLAAAISGHVYDEDGEPVEGASVSALRYIYSEGERKLNSDGEASTNDLGEYRLFGLSPGRYYLSAEFEWGRLAMVGLRSSLTESEPGKSEMAYVPTYYPGVNDVARAVMLELRSGDDLPGMDLTLLATRAVHIRGRLVISASNRGVSHATVSLHSREASARSSMPSAMAIVQDPDSNFDLTGVVPGAYVLTAAVIDLTNLENILHARIALDVGAVDIEGLIVPVGPGIDIVGRLLWEGTAPSKAALLGVYLVPADMDFDRGGVEGKVKPDGGFTLKNVGDGDYRVHAFEHSGECYVKSVRSGGVDLPSERVTVAGGKTGGALEVTMSCASGTIEGLVLNDQNQPVTGASVVLVPEAERRSERDAFKSMSTDQHGRFVMKGIAPGDYKAFAWEKIESGAYQDPEFMRRYEGAGKPVTVGEGSRLSVQLSLILAEKSQD